MSLRFALPRWRRRPLAEGGRFYGMLRSRDLTPFGFLRLDMRPAHAVSIEPHTFAFEAELGYQNTWALSRNVEKYLTSARGLGRHEIGPAEVQAIRDLPGENYLLDLESATLDLAVHYKISSQWTVYAIATAVSYQGGFLDSSIEKFHDDLGFSTFGRPAVDAQRHQPDLRSQGRAGGAARRAADTRDSCDPTFGLRYTGIKLPGRWQMSVETAVKVPLEGERLLLSTGRTDYGTAGVDAAAGRTQCAAHGFRRRVLRRRGHVPRRRTRRSSRRSSSAGSGS